MKKTFLSLAMLLSTMAVSAQSEAYVGDMNDDGELNISDVTQLVNTVIGKQAPRKVSLGGGDPYAVDNSAIAGTWRTTSGEVLTFNADGTCKISNTAYTFEYMPQLGFIAVYDSNGECPLSYNVLKKTNDMLLLNTMAQTGGKFYYTSAMFVTAIKLSSTSVNLNTGQIHQLTATVTPANAKIPTLKWASSSTGIASVDQTGLVTAKKAGKATITATSTDGTGVKATCTFNITQLVTSVTLPYTTLNIGKGSTFTIDATVSPSTANNKTLAWTSSSTAAVVSLDDGVFYAKAAGTSTITAAATDGSGKKATCKVTVLSAAPTGVSLSAKSISVKPSESAQLTATVTPSGASTATVIWTSSDPSIVTVDKTGKVTAVGTEGKATITATIAGNGSLVATADVTICSDKTFTVNGVTFTMKKVEGGTFTMGATSEQVNSGYSINSDELPTHSVTLSDYYIGETEVTQALWKAVMDASPSSSYSWSSYYGIGDSYPAYYISYDECKNFISKLNSLTGASFRMPTEAEWEYAARGGKESKGYVFSGSNTIGDVAWYTSNSSSKTHPVATKQPNELGIYDMSGNLMEWCSDWTEDYSSSAQTNPVGASSGTRRVIREGCIFSPIDDCRVTNRNNNYPYLCWGHVGMRLALQ